MILDNIVPRDRKGEKNRMMYRIFSHPSESTSVWSSFADFAIKGNPVDTALLGRDNL